MDSSGKPSVLRNPKLPMMVHAWTDVDTDTIPVEVRPPVLGQSSTLAGPGQFQRTSLPGCGAQRAPLARWSLTYLPRASSGGQDTQSESEQPEIDARTSG